MLSIQSARYGVVLNGTGTMVWICCEPFHFRPQTRLNFCLCQVSARRVYLVGAQSAVPTKLTNIGTSGQRQLDFNGLESSGRTVILLVTRRGEANLPNQSSMWLLACSTCAASEQLYTRASLTCSDSPYVCCINLNIPARHGRLQWTGCNKWFFKCQASTDPRLNACRLAQAYVSQWAIEWVFIE